MKKLIVVLLTISAFQKVNAQSDESIIRQLLDELINYSSGIDNDTVFLEECIRDTYFNHDSTSMKKTTGLSIPQKTLIEIVNNSRPVKKQSEWNEYQLNERFIVPTSKNDTVFLSRRPYVKCLSENQLDSVASIASTLSVYSISRLVFDNNQQIAVFELAFGRGGRYYLFESVLIKKIFGKWVIIQKFDSRIS